MNFASKIRRNLKDEEVLLRRALEKDAALLLNHLKQVSKEASYLLTDPTEITITIEQERNYIQQHQQGNNLLLLAFKDQQLIGNLSISNPSYKKMSHLGQLGMSVIESAQGKGIGSILLEEALMWAKNESKLQKIFLQVFADNQRAINLYQRFAFLEEGRLKKQIKAGEKKFYDLVVMSRWLDDIKNDN